MAQYPEEPLKLYDMGWELVQQDTEAMEEYYRLKDDVSKTDIYKINKNKFLEEYAWVVYVSGFKEDRIDEKWDVITAAFNFFEPEKINEDSIGHVMVHFAHRRKAEAIVKTSHLLRDLPWREFVNIYLKSPEHMQKLPFIGMATCYHLARNLGMDYAKPDRHLLRFSNHCDYENDVQAFCKYISDNRGVSIPVVDFVLWYLGEQKGTDTIENKEGSVIMKNSINVSGEWDVERISIALRTRTYPPRNYKVRIEQEEQRITMFEIADDGSERRCTGNLDKDIAIMNSFNYPEDGGTTMVSCLKVKFYENGNFATHIDIWEWKHSNESERGVSAGVWKRKK